MILFLCGVMVGILLMLFLIASCGGNDEEYDGW